jgi:hypothetical protein
MCTRPSGGDPINFPLVQDLGTTIAPKGLTEHFGSALSRFHKVGRKLLIDQDKSSVARQRERK